VLLSVTTYTGSAFIQNSELAPVLKGPNGLFSIAAKIIDIEIDFFQIFDIITENTIRYP